MTEEAILKIYELKGIINAANDLVNHDQEFDHPLMESISEKMNEVINLIEKKSVGETF